MDNDTRSYVVNLLESCQDRKRKIALLHYELNHVALTSGREMIEAMSFGHGEGGGHTDGHISDKTFYIALNYQSRAEELNADLKSEIAIQLVELEQKQKRLEYYVSLLEERQATVIQLVYFKRLPLEEIASQIGVALRTVRKIKDHAIDELAKMYDFTKSVK